MNSLMELVNDPNPATEWTLSTWAKVNSELEQSNLTLDEAVGILLQTHFKPAVGTELNKFEFMVDQNLNERKSPSFADVTTVIQSASGKVSKKANQTNHTPMEID